MDVLLEKKTVNLSKLSCVADIGPSSSTCGYCHSKERTSHTYGLWAFNLSCEDYQRMIDRGWRRSGKYLYKPNLATSCCPQYTIRLNVPSFKFSKSYKQVVMRLNRYVTGEKNVQHGDLVPAYATADIGGQFAGTASKKCPGLAAGEGARAGCQKETHNPDRGGSKMGHVSKKPNPFPVPPQVSQAAEGVLIALRRMVELVHAVDCGPVELAHRFHTELVRSEFDSETFALYCKYQSIVHQDPPSELSKERYYNFLVDSPLMAEAPFTPDHKVGLGSYHHRYYLDDRLIACGVLDILPRCISSVYFVYDPDLASLALGKYGVLREIALAAELGRYMAGLQKYYMGYYIHNCQKMKYKAVNNEPSDLLDPETYEWIPYSLCCNHLDRHRGRYVPLRRTLDEETRIRDLASPLQQYSAVSQKPNVTVGAVSIETMGGDIHIDKSLQTDEKIKEPIDEEVDNPKEENESDESRDNESDEDSDGGAMPIDFSRMPGVLDPDAIGDDVLADILILEGNTVMPALISDRIMGPSKLRKKLKRYYAVVGEDLSRRMLVEIS